MFSLVVAVGRLPLSQSLGNSFSSQFKAFGICFSRDKLPRLEFDRTRRNGRAAFPISPKYENSGASRALVSFFEVGHMDGDISIVNQPAYKRGTIPGRI